MAEGQKMEFWAVVELMGHQRMAGFVSVQSVGPAAFLRVDVPEAPGGPAFTRFVNPSAIYAINPTTEELARRAAAAFRPQPIQNWELPQLPDPARMATTVRDEDEDDYQGPGEDREF